MKTLKTKPNENKAISANVNLVVLEYLFIFFFLVDILIIFSTEPYMALKRCTMHTADERMYVACCSVVHVCTSLICCAVLFRSKIKNE